METIRMLTAAIAAAVLPLAASAQMITGMKIEPVQAQAGAPVTIMVHGEPRGDTVNCGLRMHFGDGQTRDFKITDATMLPLRVQHQYAKAGSYEVMAEPKRVTTHLKCIGANQRGVVAVAAPAAAKPVAQAVIAPSCPDGWKLDAKSLNRKTGAFMCAAKAGTAAPTGRLECPGELGYFENLKKGQLGCRA